MRLRQRIFAILSLSLIMISCATYSAEKSYLTARIQYNEEVSRYLSYFEAATDEQKAVYRKEIDPYILRASEALDLWGAALSLSNGDGTEMSNYLDTKNAMIDALAEIYKKGEP